MNEEKAREILGDWIRPATGGLYSLGAYIAWEPGKSINMDGDFSPEELKAIIWWVENSKKK